MGRVLARLTLPATLRAGAEVDVVVRPPGWLLARATGGATLRRPARSAVVAALGGERSTLEGWSLAAVEAVVASTLTRAGLLIAARHHAALTMSVHAGIAIVATRSTRTCTLRSWSAFAAAGTGAAACRTLACRATTALVALGPVRTALALLVQLILVVQMQCLSQLLQFPIGEVTPLATRDRAQL